VLDFFPCNPRRSWFRFSPASVTRAAGKLIMPNTIKLHRVLRASPEKVYRAFLDADAMTKWLPPNGFTAKVHQLDAKVGGTYKMSFTNFTTGKTHSFGGQIRRSKSARHNPGVDHLDESFLRHRAQRRSRRHPRRHSCRGVLSGLAGIADSPGETCRGRDSGLKCVQSMSFVV
jgi:hypothetical protein